MEKIKVLRIINRFNIGGPTYNATFLSAFMDDRFETVLVGGLPDIGESDSLYILEKYGVKPILLEEMVRQPNMKSDRRAYRKLKEIMRDFQPDIVHTHASKAGALGRRAARACRVPVVVHTFHGHVFHSYFGKLKTKIFKEIERNLARKTDAIIAISELQKRELTEVHEICPAEKVSVVPLGFDLDPFRAKRTTDRETTRKKFGLLPDEIAVAIVGRLAPIKNHTYFLDVAEAILERTHQKLKYFIVGDGPEREAIENRAAKINARFPNAIQLTSWITDIGSFNAGMDIVCLTSKNEGTPVSLIEAQAAGIPVVSTEVGGVRDIVLEGETGFVVPLENKEDFIERLYSLVENENIREKMSQNGWNFVRDKFHYKTLVRNIEQLYVDLIEKKRNENK